MTDLTDKEIVIAGAGIAGLTSALCCAAHGFAVTVVEKAPALTDVGAGIQLSPNATRVLAALGLLESLRARGTVPASLGMRDGITGKQVFRIPAPGSSNAPYLQVHRADVIETLGNAVELHPLIRLRLGAAVAHCDAEVGRLVLENGEHAEGAVLIGADGVHSLLRQRVFNDGAASYTGQGAWRVTVPTAALPGPLLSGEPTVWAGPGRHAVTYQLQGGALTNFVGVVESRHWPDTSWHSAGQKDEALADFAGWHPDVTNVLRAAKQHYRWALLSRPLPASWQLGRCVLVGDAAHPILPFMAQGASMAIEDAWLLAAMLGQGGDMPLAGDPFTRLRQPRVARVRQLSIDNGVRYHRGSTLGRWVSRTPLRSAAMVAPTLIQSRLRWLYDYDPTQAFA
ncbi:MAG: FAD-dependent monooxygenase [Pseudomonadota bacterium]